MRYEPRGMQFISVLTILICAVTGLAQPTRISDNSFLIEEAYNQERGVVQHILLLENIFAYRDKFSNEEMGMTFAQEWPLGTQMWQGAYAVSSNREFEDVWLDLQLRYQMPIQDNALALAPYAKIAFPIAEKGDDEINGGRLGIGLPVSATLSDQWTMHLNFSAEYLRLKEFERLGPGPAIVADYGNDAVEAGMGTSVVYSLAPIFDLMMEFVYATEMLSEPSYRNETSEALLSPGFRKAWNFTSGAQMVGGLGFPVGLKGDVPDFAGLLYLSFEHSFSGN